MSDFDELIELMKKVYAGKGQGGMLLITAVRGEDTKEGYPFYDCQIEYAMKDNDALRAMLVNTIEFFWHADKEVWDKAMLQFAHDNNLIETLPDGREIAMLHRKGEFYGSKQKGKKK